MQAAWKHFGMEDEKQEPRTNKPPHILHFESNEAKIAWLHIQVHAIKRILLSEGGDTDIEEPVTAFDEQEGNIKRMKQLDGSFKCGECNKRYASRGWILRHMRLQHEWPVVEQEAARREQPTAKAVHASFVKMAFIARDTWDAYRMGDGDRVLRNAKLEFLYAFGTWRSKYRLWLWRQTANDIALLTEREAYEHRWNVSVSLEGGIGKNIPCDDLCELQVRRIKKALATQGPNKSFESARFLCHTSQVIDELLLNLQRQSHGHRSGRGRSAVDKSGDVFRIARELQSSGFDEQVKHDSFQTFVDPLSRIQMVKLCEWVEEKKKHAKEYLSKK